ncbi:anti-sigma factor [Nakamurella deserti]|uniref:anti-sigma factor n=1 Tax=Nakamurella deserti TaxID=2164074 RepID=UPI000DBE9D20|nr:anti-sigma factor [Nakamurella deserti]
MMAHDPSLFAGGAALNALDELEAAQFRRHLEDCPTCQVELSGFAETAARLGAASSEPAPASMRSSVLAAVAVTRQLPPLTDDVAGADGTGSAVAGSGGGDGPWRDAAPADAGDRSGGEVVDLASRRRPPTRWLLSAAAAVAIALIGLSFFLVNRTSTTDNDADALKRCVSTAADREQLPTAPGSTGDTTVVVSASCGGALLSFADVPALDADQTYQLWVISGDQTRSVTTLNPAADGSMPETVAAVHLGDTALGVTVEPAGGSPTPTTTPVITVPLSA